LGITNPFWFPCITKQQEQGKKSVKMFVTFFARRRRGKYFAAAFGQKRLRRQKNAYIAMIFIILLQADANP
jgi:hypothetical protein